MPADYQWVDSDSDLAALIERLSGTSTVAVDTESNSMHAYRERVCLLQLTVDDDDILVDPLAVDVAPLGSLFADASIQKVFHGADYDVLSLKRAYGFEFANLHDTMIAARVLGWPKYGLAAILSDLFDHDADKRFQRYDWGRRPLEQNALAYARFDTHYLVEIRDRQVEQLRERDRFDECRHACERQARVEPRERSFDPDAFWKIKGASDLDAAGAAILRALFVFRDEQASRRDVPPFRVMNDSALVHLARVKPKNADALRKLKGLGPYGRNGRGRAVLRAIEKGREDDPPRRPRVERPPRAVSARFDKLRSWRKDTATAHGVEPDIVIPKSVLWAIAEADPTSLESLSDVSELDDWERNRYGEALIKLLIS